MKAAANLGADHLQSSLFIPLLQAENADRKMTGQGLANGGWSQDTHGAGKGWK